MSLVLGFATWQWDGWQQCVNGWNQNAMFPRRTTIEYERRVVDAYQAIYERTKEGVIAYIHDDLICLEQDWDYRVMHEFLDPKVGVVGLAGGTMHGSADLYNPPFIISKLARGGFMSNLREAEIHGKRFTGECNVAVLDGIALFVRREVLRATGGWPVNTPIDYFLYSEWICCMARRLGYKIRMVGVKCDHLGGRSTGLNQTAKFDYEGEHRWLWENFKDVLPVEVQP